MKEEKVLYLGVITKPGNPDSGYMKLYPKADGWYSLDPDGNEIRLEGVIIIDEAGQELTQKNRLEFAAPFKSEVSGNKILVSLDALGFSHDNTFHVPDFATEANFIAHEDDETVVHGLNVPDINTKIHAQNTDTALDQGGDNEISAAELKGVADLTEITIDDASNKDMVASERIILSRSSVEENVNYFLPNASAMPNKDIVIRKDKWDNYALVVQTGGGEDLYYNGAALGAGGGVTTDNIGAWIRVKSNGTSWFVIMDSGNWEVKA